MANILLLVGAASDPDPTPGDVAQHDRLVADGHTVTPRLDSDANKDVTGFDAVVISRTVTVPPDDYADVPCGLLSGTWWTWPNLDMSTQPVSANPLSQTVYLEGHPIVAMAGLTAGATFSPAWETGAGGRLARTSAVTEDAQVVARFDGSSAIDLLAFAYEAGATMHNAHVAEGRRVGMTTPDAGADLMEPETLDLWAAAVAWVAGLDGTGLRLLMSVADVNTLSTSEQAFFDWRTDQGDTITLINHADSVPADLSGVDLVVFPDSMNGNQADKWDDVDIPVLGIGLRVPIHSEVENRGYSSQGDTRLTRWVESTVATPAAASSVTVYDSTPPDGYDYYPEENIAPNVVILSRHEESGSRITGILVPAGTELFNSATCPSRRTTIPFDHFQAASDDGLALAAQLIDWLVEAPGPGPVVTTTLVSATDGAALEILGMTDTGWA